MSVNVTDEKYTDPETGEVEHERYVSNDHASASIYDDSVYLDLHAGPDLRISHERLIGLKEVVDAAVELITPKETGG